MVSGTSHRGGENGDLTEIARSWVTARVDVLGVGVSVIDMSMALELIDQWISRGDHQYVCVTGVHGIMESQRDSSLRDVHNRSGLTTPDGMPLVWAGRAAGAQHMKRVYGPDLMLALCGQARAQGYSSYFYGGRPGVADRLAQRLQELYPGLRIAGRYAPPFRELSADEDDDVVRLINRAKPDLVWVGLGTPKQELWMAAHARRLDANVLIGVGAAFDIHAGLSPQAPRWIQGCGLEWAFRLVHEPRRLWRRYLYNNPRFLAGLARRPPWLVPVTPAAGEPLPAGEPPAAGTSPATGPRTRKIGMR
jgi:N-acetylglucosaminyldiphosphoundecaprenol N-acetyl-beta-D-mannosaminyltransferase